MITLVLVPLVIPLGFITIIKMMVVAEDGQQLGHLALHILNLIHGALGLIMVIGLAKLGLITTILMQVPHHTLVKQVHVEPLQVLLCALLLVQTLLILVAQQSL